MNSMIILGMAITLVLIVGLSFYSGTGKTKKEGNSSFVVAGVIIGTIVGGASTVGTAQLAYTYGMSAWWFTLGSGIACLILSLIYTVPLRKTGSPTLVGIIGKEYGSVVGMSASILSCIGTFINIITQLLAASAVIAVIFPKMGLIPEIIFSAFIMLLYVVFGGTKGAGIVGIAKTILLYTSMMLCGIMVLYLTGGFSGFLNMVNSINNPEGINFYSVFSRGVGTDLGACFSLIFGVLTTQTYAQAVLSAKNDKEGKRGALIGAFLTPPIGIGGILVGLYMRANEAAYPGLIPKTALTVFVTNHLPPLISGVILGTLFFAVVGTGAGLVLGIATVINNDIVKRMISIDGFEKNKNRLSVLWMLLLLSLGVFLSSGKIGDTIIQFAFMSLGLRGAVVFTPLLCALWLPGKIPSKYAMVSIVGSPILVLLFGLWGVLPFDSLFIGILFSIVVFVLGYNKTEKT